MPWGLQRRHRPLERCSFPIAGHPYPIKGNIRQGVSEHFSCFKSKCGRWVRLRGFELVDEQRDSPLHQKSLPAQCRARKPTNQVEPKKRVWSEPNEDQMIINVIAMSLEHEFHRMPWTDLRQWERDELHQWEWRGFSSFLAHDWASNCCCPQSSKRNKVTYSRYDH